MMRLIPGDAIDVMFARMNAMGGEGIDRAELEKMLGIDGPASIQFGRWIGVLPQVDGGFSGLLQGDLGTSLWNDNSVMKTFARRWPVTLEIGIMGILTAILIAVPIGVYSAIRQDTAKDYLFRSVAIIFMAVPPFWLGTLVLVFPGIWWGYMPPFMLIKFADDPLGNLEMFSIPGIVLGLSLTGTMMRLTRTMMLDVVRQDYIRTAWSKGLRERVIMIRHALRNALIPLVTFIGILAPITVGGTIIIEIVFNLPGMGHLIIESIKERDYPLISGVMIFFGFFVMMINLIVDLTCAYLDPRVRL